MVITSHFLFDLLLSGGLCFLATFFVSFLMRRIGLYDVPGTRSSHQRPTSRGGGIALIIGFSLGSVFFFPLDGVPFLGPYLIWILFSCCCFCMAGLGFLDDLKTLRASTRLSVQLLVASAFTGFGVSLQTLTFPLFGDVILGAWGPLLTVVWLVGFTNAFNFIDGLNGLSMGQAVIASLFLCLIGWHHQNIPLFDLSFFFMASGLGFLLWNFPKGLIFLGDSGSYFVGFFWAGLALIATILGASDLSFWTFPLLFFMALMDVALTLLRRLRKKKNIFMPHREYHMQLLHRCGWSHQRVSLVYWGFSLLQGSLAFMMQKTPPYQHLYFYLPMLIVSALFFPWVCWKARQRGIDF